MYNLTDIESVMPLMKKNGFNFSKNLGQNFIIDPGVCPEMAERSGIDRESAVLEIGPGIGVLTAELAKRAKKVLCIELDKRLLPVLAETLKDFDNVEVVNADVMKLDLGKLIEEKFGDTDVYVCANLPYYITSPVIMKLLESRLPVKAITVMVQKEAADRICAPVGSRDSGAITVAVNYYAQTEKLFDVPSESFMPSPKVDSSVIRMNIREKPPVEIKDEEFFFSVVKAAFGQRRKTALNSLSSGLGISKQTVEQALVNCGFDTNVRAETMTMDKLAEICNCLFKK
ncbi:MAG: 16S rRNA (adenine(1518)-N(6)/adenine(1519)-N(6))-dimethyltransferase RsmA [Clostridia bacterium]|nr:16S rRNA (adenine(1518)-N(6)/adenine(1519)-N(6))-dimethyltransferase RsmA [Clostridia bacterium]